MPEKPHKRNKTLIKTSSEVDYLTTLLVTNRARSKREVPRWCTTYHNLAQVRLKGSRRSISHLRCNRLDRVRIRVPLE